MRTCLTSLALALLCLVPLAVPVSAAAAPAITGLRLSSSAVPPGAPIGLTVSITQPAPWRLDVLTQCGTTPVRSLTGYGASDPFFVEWDGVDTGAAPLAPGSYRFRVTLLDAKGQAVASPMDMPFTVTGAATNNICNVVSTFGSSDVFHQGLAALAASSSRSAVISTAVDAGYAAVASSYAHRYGLPLVLLSKGASIKSLAKALAARHVKAVIIGSTYMVSALIQKTLAKRVTVVRIKGVDRAATAALVAARIKPAESSTAVYAALGGDPALIAVASAYANAIGVPLLSADATTPKSTLDATAALHLSGGVAIGNSKNISALALRALPGVARVIGKDLASTSFVLARSLPKVKPTLVLDVAATVDPLTLIERAQTGEPQLLLGAGELSTAQRTWLVARSDISAISATPRVPVALTTSIAQLIGSRGALGSLPPVQVKPAPPVVVPSSFTFSGSGFGHGVGMSQWGAYGMAMESNTATQILQHYFTGSIVAPIVDTMDVNVSLSSRVASQSFRLESLSDPSSTLEMTSAEGAVTLLPVNEVITTKYVSGRIAVSASGPTPVPAFSTTSLTFKWPGNRDTGTATGGPAILRVAGPGVSIAHGARYRYGYVSVTVSKLSGALRLGLQVNNILRLHDEYLYGIAEVSSSWPEAAIQAQIITARSYAYRKVKAGIRSACACNVYDDTRDQNFTGYSKLAESGGAGARWKAAVDGTAASDSQGLALTVGGQVVPAYYSAADGGKTQNNEDVWGGAPLSYTRSVDDPWSLEYAAPSVSRWVPRAFTQSRIAAAFGAPDVAYLDLSNRYASGAVNFAVAISSSGQRFTLGGETLKARLNSGLGDAEVLSRGIPSVWIWRVDTEVPTTSAAAAAMQFSAGTTSIGAKLPMATSTSVVITQASPSDTVTAANPVLTLAAAYAGARQAGLLVNTTNNLDPAVRSELLRRKATQVVLVGPLPPTLVPTLVGLKISVIQIDAPTVPALSVRLATSLGLPAGSPIVLVSRQDLASQPLAVSLAARGRIPLIMLDGGVLSSEVSAYLMSAQPKSTTVVGSAAAIPDVVVAGVTTTVTRLTTSDISSASIIVASQYLDTSTVAVVIASTTAVQAALVVAAASGLPLYYVPALQTVDTSTVTSAATAPTLPVEVLALIPRLPAFTLVYRVQTPAEAISALRNA